VIVEHVAYLLLRFSNSKLIIQRIFFFQKVHSKVGGILVLQAWKQSSLNLNSLSLTGHNWEASFYYNKALRIKPTHTESLLGAARVLRAKGQYTRIHHIMHRLVIHIACPMCDSPIHTHIRRVPLAIVKYTHIPRVP
jgi:hypothetical protein